MSAQPRQERLTLDPGTVLRRKAGTVQNLAAFRDIPQADCMAIVSTAMERHFARRQTIFFEGDAVHHVMLLTSGCVKVTQLGANGNEVILRLAGPGDALGAVGASAGSFHGSTARTVQPSSALIWENRQFDAVAERFPLLRRNILHVLECQLNELDVRYREISTEKVGSRLSSQLVRLFSQVGKQNDGHVEIALSRRELAQLTGTTLFTVSRLLCNWETQGIVSAKREAVLVRNLSALQQLSRAE